MLTENEKNVLRMLLTAFDKDYSINAIAKNCKIAPNGALKILRKFEQEGILISKDIANIKSYSINFDNEKTKNVLELALIPELKGNLKYRKEDLSILKNVTEACIIFGSYITEKKDPNDMDTLFLIKKEQFKEYKGLIKKTYPPMPIKVHDVLQTEEDMIENINNKDQIVLKALSQGIILWGYDKIFELAKNGYK